MKKPLLLHPLLFAAYPVLSLLAFNIDQTPPEQAVRSLLVVVASAAVYLATARLIAKDWGRAGLSVSLFFLLFFSFGHVLRLSERVMPSVPILDRYRYLFALWIALIIVGTWWIWRVLQRDVGRVTRFLNVVASAALILPAFTIVSFTLQWVGSDAVPANSLPQTSLASASPSSGEQEKPDIYYIILDGYARADVLAEIYQDDSGEFLNFLAGKGFFIASKSHSNYAQTNLSLASSLNFTYLDTVAENAGRDTQDRGPLTEMIQDNRVKAFLQQQGYQFVSIASGFPATELTNADVYLSGQKNTLNNFEYMVLADTLPGVILLSRSLLYDQHRQTVLNVFDQLAEATRLSGPKFVFAHVIAPHPPFVFDRDGNAVQPDRDYTIADGIVYGATREEYIDGYREQLLFLNTQLENTIDDILANSETPPIIILQGDHGPGAFLEWESMERTCLRERLSILNAYLVPQEVADQLYDTITPVNTFRLLFNHLFNQDLDLLADDSYFSAWERPYDLIDVTGRIEESCPAP